MQAPGGFLFHHLYREPLGHIAKGRLIHRPAHGGGKLCPQHLLPVLHLSLQPIPQPARFVFQALHAHAVQPGEYPLRRHQPCELFAGQLVLRQLQGVKFCQQLRGKPLSDDKLGNGGAVFPQHRPAGWLKHHVKHAAIVAGIALMAVAIPVVTIHMELHLAMKQHAIEPDAGREEVGPLVVVVSAGVKNVHSLPAAGAQVSGVKVAFSPHKMEQRLGGEGK